MTVSARNRRRVLCAAFGIGALSLCSILLMRQGPTPSVTAALSRFPDVPDVHPYREAIEYMAEIGIIKGYPDGSFHPDDRIQRDEIVKMVMGDVPENDRNQCAKDTPLPFPDVSGKSWSGPYICMAKRLGIVS